MKDMYEIVIKHCKEISNSLECYPDDVLLIAKLEELTALLWDYDKDEEESKKS